MTIEAFQKKTGNPIFTGWYADPEARIFAGQYWVYPTYSAPYKEQTYFDAFYSNDLVHWTKAERILEMKDISWARLAMWAPSPIERNGKYYYYFAANDIQSNEEYGGIGVAVADRPEGPFRDAIGNQISGIDTGFWLNVDDHSIFVANRHNVNPSMFAE